MRTKPSQIFGAPHWYLWVVKNVSRVHRGDVEGPRRVEVSATVVCRS